MSGSLNIEEIVNIQKKYPQYKCIKCFVETGTFKGNTIFHMENYFARLYTIELYNENYKEVICNSKKHKKISFYLGDSSDILPTLILKINEPSVFYLDGHFCGQNSSGGHFPLFNEIRSIGSLRNYNDIVIIDDYGSFGNKNGHSLYKEWKDVSEENVMKYFDKSKVFSYFVRNDRFYILIKTV